MARTACVKRIIASGIVAIILLPCFKLTSSANAQYVEAPTIFENGVRKSMQLTVHFKEKAFDLPQGVREAQINDIDPSLPKLRNFFEGLQSKHGDIDFVKVIPDAKWGDVWRRHRRTGELVQLHDMSQLFFVKFAQFVPIDSIIVELQGLPEVEYAHRPIEAISLVDPNDPLYPNGQWNLKKIDASKAWDITTGSSSIIVGIIEVSDVGGGLPDKNHKDFWTGPGSTGQSKFVTGKGDGSGFGVHATNVAGVVGAATNDGDGVASLGWNIKMIPYRFSNYESGLNNLVDKINQAIIDNCDVINCSFVTRSLTGQEIQGCRVYTSQSYGGVATAISSAITAGIVVVAGVGNRGLELTDQSEPCNNQEVLDTRIPYNPYPASYSNVIGVSASDSNDVWAGGRPYNYEDLDVDFIDVAAPGIDLKLVSPNNGYFVDSGTSFAAPHVSALTGLILSVTSLPGSSIVSTVTDIIRKTALDFGSPGVDDYWGYGRINAYQALLLTHAYSSKSVSTEAIGSNSARHLAKQGTNTFHKVFESGITSGGSVLGEIFYRKSTNDGSTWNTPVRLSSGNEQNRYPCIAERSGNLFVVWQRYNGSKHFIYFRKSTTGGATWANATQLDSIVSTSLPLPVIVSPATNELIAVYRSGNNLKWRRSTDNGSNWSTPATFTGTALNSPSVAPARTPWGAVTTALAYATADIPNTSNIIAHYYNNGWSQQHNMTAGLPGYLTQHAHPSIAASADLSSLTHVAWDAYDSQYAARVILHKVMSSWNVPSSYYEFHYQTEDRPSISGLTGATAMMVFQRGTNWYHFTARYDGSYWNVQFPALSGFHPSISVGSTSTKYLWTSGTGSPYTLNISANYFTKPAESVTVQPLNPQTCHSERSEESLSTSTLKRFLAALEMTKHLNCYLKAIHTVLSTIARLR